MDFYYLKTTHLGDQWARINKAIKYDNITIAVYPPIWNTVTEICNLLDIKVPLIKGKKKTPHMSQLIENTTAYQIKYLPTKKTHDPKNVEDMIAYNISANWRKEMKVPENIEEIIRTIQSKIPNIKFVPVGLPQNLTEIVNILSKAKLFLGIDSGVAHVARSVGIPLFLIEHKLPLSRGFPRSVCNYTKVTTDTVIDIIVGYINRKVKII